MRFDIDAPGCQCSMERLAFNAYAHHQSVIDEYINRLAAADDPNDGAAQADLLYDVGLSPSDLTSDDIEYIEREVSKRCQQAHVFI